MVRQATTRNARCVKTNSGPAITTTPVPRDSRRERHARDPRGRYTVHSREGQLGVLKAVLSAPRLLLLDAPQAPGGVLLIPFEAIDEINIVERSVSLRPARESLVLAGNRPASPRRGMTAAPCPIVVVSEAAPLPELDDAVGHD